MLYRKKPLNIEAFRLGSEKAPSWFWDAFIDNQVNLLSDGSADIMTLEGTHHANKGDYIIQGVKGELYPCKPEIFMITYEPVEE